MKSIRFSIFAILFLFLTSTLARGQKIIKILDYIPIQISNRVNLLPAPSLSYSPETNWSFGTALVLNHKQSIASQRTSTMQLDLQYTLNKQVIVDFDYHWNGLNNKLIVFGSNSFYDYPDLYFSVNNAGESEYISYKKIEFENKAFYKLANEWKGGILHRLQIIKDLDDPETSHLNIDRPTGYTGGLSHGIGLGVLNDQRENTLNPAAGSSLFNFNLTTFNSVIGSDFNFNRIEMDLRKYYSFLKKNIIAIQFVGISNTGDPPFKLSANLGGRRILRGYHNSRYIDKHMLAIQTEVRMNIYQRIGAVIFAGLGTTSTSLSKVFQQPMKASLGGGLRFMLDKQNQANLRFDVAYGMDGLAYYFSYGEAF